MGVTKSVVLLSGGLDSAVALALVPGPVEALTVDYGQRHRREIISACDIADHYDVPHRVVEVDPVLFRGSALTGTGPLPSGVALTPDDTYVPARNTVLIALATARAEVLGAQTVIIGANADDASAYPDCRLPYLAAMSATLKLGTVGEVGVRAPLLSHTKREVVNMAHHLNVPIEMTWSCYEGGTQPCRKCGACTTRYGN